MKRKTKKIARHPDGMRKEYDFSNGVRGKHTAAYADGANIVLLAPDVAKEFPTVEDVNETLRAIAKIMQRRKGRRRTA